MSFALSLAWGFCFGKRRIAMSSYYELKWRDEDLSKYSTDKLYFIWNVVKQPLRPEYRQMLGELKWRQAKKKQTNALAKIKDLDTRRKENNDRYLIEVDGGINETTGKKCKDAGVDVLVAGSYIFNSDDYAQRIASLK